MIQIQIHYYKIFLTFINVLHNFKVFLKFTGYRCEWGMDLFNFGGSHEITTMLMQSLKHIIYINTFHCRVRPRLCCCYKNVKSQRACFYLKFQRSLKKILIDLTTTVHCKLDRRRRSNLCDIYCITF